MMINQTPINTPLTRDAILALNDDDLTALHRLLQRDALAHLHSYTEPCCSEYHPDPEPHGMHSDDGNDYLIAAIDIASELMMNDPIMRSDLADFRNWLTNKIDPDADDSLINYACDGVSPLCYELLWSAELDAVLDAPLTNEGN